MARLIPLQILRLGATGFLAAVMMLSPAAFSQSINWDNLGLSAGQTSEIDRLETEWKQTYSQIQPLIERDRNELRRLLNDPNANESQVMTIQTRLHRNEEHLRNEATRIFMQKKNQLNPNQKQRLQTMMGQ